MYTANGVRRSSVPAVDVGDDGGEVLKPAAVEVACSGGAVEMSPEHAIDILSPISEHERRDVMQDRGAKPSLRWVAPHGHTRTTSSVSSASDRSGGSSTGSSSFTIMPNTFYTHTPLTFADFQHQSQFGPSAPATAHGTAAGSKNQPSHQASPDEQLSEDEKEAANNAHRIFYPKHFTFPKERYPSNPASRHTESSHSGMESVSVAPDQKKFVKEPMDDQESTANTQVQATPVEAIVTKAPATPSLTHDSIVPAVMQSVFGGAIYGYNTGIIAGLSGPLIKAQWFSESASNFQASMTGVLVSSVLVGGWVGSMIGVPLTQRVGRKMAFVITGLICVAACLALGFVESFIAVVLIRAALGVSVGMTATVCPLYNAECTAVERRGAVGTTYQVSIVSAILLAQIVNYAFNSQNNASVSVSSWHIQFALGGIFGVGLVVIGLTVPESHVWQTNRVRERQKRLNKIEAARRQWTRNHEERARASQPANGTVVRVRQAPTAAAVPEPLPPKVHKGWLGLFHFSNWRWVSVACVLAAGNQLTGVNAIMYYAPRIFEDAGFEKMALVLTIAVVGTWNLVAVLLAIPLVKQLSRRTMLFIAHGIMALGLGLITLAFAFFPEQRAIPSIFAIVLFILGFEIGPGPLFFVLASEVFPPTILHAGLSFANQLAWLCNILITFLFPLLSNAIGASGTFGIFLIVCILSVLGYIVLLPSEAGHENVAMEMASAEPTAPMQLFDGSPAAPATTNSNTESPRQAQSQPAQLELMPSPPVPSARAVSNQSPPYQAKDQSQQPRQWETPTEKKKHPIQSPAPSPEPSAAALVFTARVM